MRKKLAVVVMTLLVAATLSTIVGSAVSNVSANSAQ